MCWRLQTAARFYANGVPVIRWQRKKATKYRMKRRNEGNAISPHPSICGFVFALGAFFSSSKYPLVFRSSSFVTFHIPMSHVLVFVNMYLQHSHHSAPPAGSSTLFALPCICIFIVDTRSPHGSTTH